MKFSAPTSIRVMGHSFQNRDLSFWVEPHFPIKWLLVSDTLAGASVLAASAPTPVSSEQTSVIFAGHHGVSLAAGVAGGPISHDSSHPRGLPLTGAGQELEDTFFPLPSPGRQF